MENYKIYLVSFSDSNRYILKGDEDKTKAKLVEIERSLDEYLSKKFPDETFAYYTSPKVVEISEEIANHQFKGCLPLDDKAIAEIKKELVNEIQDMKSNKEISKNAPFSDVDAQDADIPASVASIL